MRRYPILTAHVIVESLGYATPSRAADIVRDARQRRPNCCEWIACYSGDPLPAVKNAIKNRHTHSGFLAEYKLALALVRRALETGDEPVFASWF
ncbi:MAG: hypothetical protein JW724_04640 [Candidatus Altiarchaeota archaeon]|nr:hypothetical protein [Candidatus Altiarchaeota archaeon]